MTGPLEQMKSLQYSINLPNNPVYCEAVSNWDKCSPNCEFRLDLSSAGNRHHRVLKGTQRCNSGRTAESDRRPASKMRSNLIFTTWCPTIWRNKHGVLRMWAEKYSTLGILSIYLSAADSEKGEAVWRISDSPLPVRFEMNCSTAFSPYQYQPIGLQYSALVYHLEFCAVCGCLPDVH